MRSARTVQMDSHAAATLHYIRESMEAAASVAVPGSAGMAMGSVGLLAMALSLAPGLADHWFAIWLIAAALAGTVGAVLMARPSSLRTLTLTSAPGRNFALCLFPSLFGGAVMTGVLWSCGNLHAIPGTWLLMYGCALIAASVTTLRAIAVMGSLFAALGLLSLLLPDSVQPLMLGSGFGGLHLLFGLALGRGRSVRQV